MPRHNMGLVRKLGLVLIVFLTLTQVAPAAQTVRVEVGHATTLDLNGPAHTIAVGDANVASATLAFEDTLMVIGKSPGTTNVVALDENGAEIGNAMIQVGGRYTIDVLGAGDRRSYVCSTRTTCVPVETAP